MSCGQYIGEMARYLLAAPPSSLDTAHSVRLMFGTVYRTDYWPLDTTVQVTDYDRTSGRSSPADSAFQTLQSSTAPLRETPISSTTTTRWVMFMFHLELLRHPIETVFIICASGRSRWVCAGAVQLAAPAGADPGGRGGAAAAGPRPRALHPLQGNTAPPCGAATVLQVGEPGEFVGVIQAGHPVREFTGYSDKESTARKVGLDWITAY